LPPEGLRGGRRGDNASLARGLSVEAGQSHIDFDRNLPVPDFNTPRSYGGDFRIVRDQDNGAALLAQFPEQLKDGLSRVGIKVAGRFIREDKPRIVD
jgi:hypothetical protein